jgi:hypothetical protein
MNGLTLPMLVIVGMRPSGMLCRDPPRRSRWSWSSLLGIVIGPEALEIARSTTPRSS